MLAGCHRHHHGGTAGGGGGATVTPQTEAQKTLYALGEIMGQRTTEFSLTLDDLAFVQQGMRDQVTGAHPQVDVQQYGRKLGDLSRARTAARAEVEHQRGAAFAATAAQETGAVKLSSGLVYRDLRVGNGPQPAGSDTVRVNYRGTLIDGTVFDSSYDRHEPAQFALGGVIPCWTEGLQRMHVGGQAKLVCPASIAYGDRGQRNIPAGATLVFEVELLAIVPPAPPTGGINGMPGPGPAVQAPMPVHP